MAGFSGNHGMIVGLALSLLMAVALPWGAAGAEPGDHKVGPKGVSDIDSTLPGSKSASADESTGETGIQEETDACDKSNPIRMSTDGVNEVALDAEGHRHFASGKQEKLHETVLLQPEATEKAADGAMPRSEQAVAPADGPSASGSTSLGVSLLMCIGMALLGLVMA